MSKPKICPRCKGTGKKGKNLCQACNPSGAIGDRVVGAGQRLADRLTGTSTRLTPTGVVQTRRGRQTVSALPDGLTPPGTTGINPQACDLCESTAGPLRLTRKGAVCAYGCSES